VVPDEGWNNFPWDVGTMAIFVKVDHGMGAIVDID